MDDSRPKRETMSIEDATVSNMWGIAAIVEVLERKGLCTKEDLDDIMQQALTLVARSSDGNIQPLDDDVQDARRDVLTICTAGHR